MGEGRSYSSKCHSVACTIPRLSILDELDFEIAFSMWLDHYAGCSNGDDGTEEVVRELIAEAMVEAVGAEIPGDGLGLFVD